MDPWEEISRPPEPDTVALRHADPEHPLNFYRGKDYQGNIIFRFIGQFTLDRGTKLPKLAGIDVSSEQLDDGKSQLTLGLISGGDEDIFRALCSNLMEATANVPPDNDQAAVEVVLARLKRWRDLLKTRREKLLSKSDQIGLFGELIFLRDLFIKHLGAREALSAWRGPRSDEQDFLYGNWLMEVKSQMSSSDRKIHVSSQDQLDPVSGEIILCHQTLGVSSETDQNAWTLKGLVQEIREIASNTDPYAGELLEGNLIEVGYADHEDYDRDFLLLNQRLFFRVDGAFPRIVAADIRPGVEDVRYSIRIEECAGWELAESDVTDRVFSGDG